MTVQVGLCQTCSETTLLVFPRGGSSNDLIQLIIGDLEQDYTCYNGNKSTSQVDRGAFSAVANKYKVSVSTVTHFVSGKNQKNLSVDTDQ